MTAAEAQRLVAELAAAFRVDLTEATLNAYTARLVDLDVEPAHAAMLHVQQTASFFPTIAELRRVYAIAKLGAPAPMHAFEQATARGFLNRHPLVQRAKKMVGDNWTWQNEPTHFLRKPFLDAYAEVLAGAMLAIQAPGAHVDVEQLPVAPAQIEAGT